MRISAIGAQALYDLPEATRRITAAHAEAGGDITKAAKSLGISRRAWYKMTARLGLSLPATRGVKTA